MTNGEICMLSQKNNINLQRYDKQICNDMVLPKAKDTAMQH